MSRQPRRRFLFAASALAVWPSAALAQTERRSARVAVLVQVTAAAAKPFLDALIEQMTGRGWREGVNIEYVIQYAGGTARLDSLAAELVAQKPDLILAANTAGALAARKHTSSIPIVFSFVFDPVALGLVASLSKPGGNVTGTTTRFEGLWGKRLQLLHEALPSLRRVAVLYDPSDAEDVTTARNLQAAASELTLEVQPFTARRPEDISGSFSAMKSERMGAVMTGGSGLIFEHRKLIADVAMEHRIPTFGVTEDKVEAGMLMSYGINLLGQYLITARYADRILRGARPSDLPVEQPTVLRLCVNLKTAKLLGITIPQSILLRADRVIE